MKDLKNNTSHLLIQTNDSQNFVIQSIARSKDELFYAEEIANRKALNYPPFSQIIKLIYKNEDQVKVDEETKKVYNLLVKEKQENCQVIAPLEPIISKIRGKYLKQIIIKRKPAQKFSKKEWIKEVTKKGWTIDVDPESIL